MKDSFNDYLLGRKLYGDDFSIEEILKWFNDEKNGYFDFKNGKPYHYDYHSLNIFHGYRFLKKKEFKNVLGIGSAFGDEFMPILGRIKKLTILESAEGFFRADIIGLPVTYVKPNPRGTLPFEDNYFDLITCLGTLHHIANISFALKEIYRCLEKNGYLLLREPTVSQGNWRFKRIGLTKRERGIPIRIFDSILCNCGFKIIKRRKCAFPLSRYLGYFLKTSPYNNIFIVLLDYFLSNLFSFNEIYHAEYAWQKIQPKMVVYLARK